MYGKIIKITALICVLALCLCGCDLLPSENNELLCAPELTGDLLPVQKALTDSVSGKFTLKYPTSGNYRSAFILTDLDGDNTNEAVAFYSTTTDGTVTMHLNLIMQKNGVWKSVADQKITAGNVEKVSFYDLDGDGVKEILVGWGIYSKIEKQLVAYSLSGNTLVSRLQEIYTDFTVCDLQNKHENNLLTVTLNNGYNYSFARYLKLTNDGVEELGICAVDSGVTSIETPVVTKLADNTSAVLFDAYKGSGTVTQLICFWDDMLVNPFFEPESLKTVKTQRQQNIKSKDINSDGIVEIPMSESFPLPKGITDFEPSVLTKWCAVSDAENADLLPVKYTVMNYTDGYYFEIPSDFAEKITVKKDTAERTRTFYLFNGEDESLSDELFSLRVFSKDVWDLNTTETENYTEVAKNGTAVYVVKLGKTAEANGITLEKIINSFFVLSED